MMSVGKARTRAGVSVTAVLLTSLLSACATMPTGGPVVRGSGGDGSNDSSGNYVRMLPAGPQKGADAKGLVRGFLTDMASFEDDHSTAREYLGSKTRPDWSSNGPVLVYESMDAVELDTKTNDEGNAATVRMRAPQSATIKSDGQYKPAGSDSMIDVTFKLAKNKNDEWRIFELPNELILGRTDVERAYRPLNLYFFNRDRSTLVPDPVLLPVSRDRLATRLTTMLADGPTQWLAPAVTSAFPKGSEAEADLDSETGELSVELSDVGDLDSQDRLQMGAQLDWTLKQLPEIKSFTLSVDGDEVEFPDNAGENLQSDGDFWKSLNPSGVSGKLSAYFVRNGQLWSLSGNGHDGKQEETRVQGAPGNGETKLARYAVSLNEQHIAGIKSDHTGVVTAEAEENSTYETVLSGERFTALSWDAHGNLWVAQRDATNGKGDKKNQGSKLWMVRNGTDPVEVNAPELRGEQITQLRVSRDGSRVAALTKRPGDDHRRLSVGRVVVNDQKVSVGGFLPIANELRDVSDISWNDGDQLAVLGQKEDGALQGLLVSLDGSSETTSTGAPSGTDMSTVAAAPGRPMLSGTTDNRVWMTNDRVAWQRVTDGATPVYPG